MLLAVSINNTHAAFGVYDGERSVETWRVRTAPLRTTDEYSVILRSLCQAADLEFGSLREVVIGSVVPSHTPAFVELAQRYLKADPVVVGPGIKTGIRLQVENPREVGADRIANTIAAQKKYGGPAIVLDMGTATTFSVLSEGAEFLGGAIAPGLEISLQALTDRAALLHRVELVRPRTAIGRNTVTNIQAGIVFGYVGLVEGMIARIKAELGPCKVIGTGGLIGVVAPETSVVDHVDRQLTLDGLRLLWELNQ
jgi:type III pantothenate kinase